MKRLFVAAVLLLAALPLRAQIPDARLMPAGAFRWAFTPSWKSWDRVLDVNGDERLLTSLASSDSAGADLFSPMAAAEKAVQYIIADTTYRMTLGAMKTALDADARRFPLDFAVGLGRRVTFTAGFPIVVTRMNAVLTLDSTSGNLGWNQMATAAGNSGGASQIATLFSQLDASLMQLNIRLAPGGALGCPGGPQCGPATSAYNRAAALRYNLNTLVGQVANIAAIPTPGFRVVGPAGAQSAAPLATSAAGLAINAAILSVSQLLALYGAPGITETLPLPAKRLSASDVQTIVGTPALGYGDSPFDYTKVTGLGDAELGIRVGAVQTPHARVVLFGGARLPTGKRDSPLNLIDIAPADRQLDLTAGFEAALEPGSTIALSLAGSFTRQFPDELDRRVAPQEQVITTAPVVRVRRDLGDELYLSAFPGIRLNDAFRVYAGGTYYHKGADRYSGTADADSIGIRTEMQATSFTGGIQYRSVGGAEKLPVEAGLTYSAVYTGSGGFTPKATTLTMYLRFYYRLWGAKAAAVPG